MSLFQIVFGKSSAKPATVVTSSDPDFLSYSVTVTTIVTAFFIFLGVVLSDIETKDRTDFSKERNERENKRLLNENRSLLEENQRLKKTISIYEGSPTELQSLKFSECERYETVLKSTLHSIEQRKCLLLKDEIEYEKGNRLCIICQENDKTILLLPCRHLCLCADCASNMTGLVQCPLCRSAVSQKVSVFV